MREGTIFQLALKPKDFPAGLRLRNIEWGVLFALDGTTPMGQIRRVFGISEEDLEPICALLLENGLIREKPVSLSEYMAAQTAASGKKTLSLLEMLQGGTAIRALTLDTGKGPAQPLNASAGQSSSMQAAKLTPPPLPPEALVAMAQRPEDSVEPLLEPEPMQPAYGGPSPSAPLLPPVGPSYNAGGITGQSGSGSMSAQTISQPKPLSPGPVASAPRKPMISSASATAILGKVTPLLSSPPMGTSVALNRISSTDSSVLAAVPSPVTTETDTADATASIINPASEVHGFLESDYAAEIPPTADLTVAEALPAVETEGEGMPALSMPPIVIPLPVPVGAGRRRLSLKNVIEFILTRADDENAGQLDVYRVFIRVNTRLLKRNGVHSLRFEEDRVITDIELQDAILASVERTLGEACPTSVFM